ADCGGPCGGRSTYHAGDAARMLTGKSRVVTGFHRLGLLLAVPVFVLAVGGAIFALFSENGPVVPDSAVPKLPRAVVLATQAPSKDVGKMTDDQRVAALGQSLVRDGAAERIVGISIDMGPIRTFDLYWAYPVNKSTGAAQRHLDEAATSDIITSIANF